jgi:RNA polymerase sigma factor (sigma-70 family)
MVELIPYLTFTGALFACALIALKWLEVRAAVAVRTPEGWSFAVPADRPDFKQIVRSHTRHVRSVARRCDVPPRDLDDAVQDVWVAVSQALSREVPRDIKKWLTGFTWRIASNYRQKRRPILVDAVTLEPVADPDCDAEEQIIAIEPVASLEPTCRAAMLAHMEGYSVREIARKFGISKDTVVLRLKMARMGMRGALAP